MKSTLCLITEKSKQDKRLKFTSLIHHLNEKHLKQCYGELKRNKASGIDGVTVDDYGKDLEKNITHLVEGLKTRQYQPLPVRRVYIPKAGKSHEKRGLGIPNVEDKLVQLMVKKLLEAIFEADFEEFSYGFRPNRSCITAINHLDKVMMTRPVNYIVEVDIRKFFDTVSHYWLQRCLEERVNDANLLWLIRRILKAGVMEDGKYHVSEKGTPQGGVVSPLLANIYLHYVLDKWFVKQFKPRSKGYVQMIRYSDDFVVCCENEIDAKLFLSELVERFSNFGLTISPEKTKIVKIGRQAWKDWQRTGKKPDSFNFLGFTHYCATSRGGKFIMGHKTARENIRRKLQAIRDWLKSIRCRWKLKDWWPILQAKVRGHYNYFGVSGNHRSLKQFHCRVTELALKWINHRSQRKSMSWETFSRYLHFNPLPPPKIYHSLYTLKPIK
jgi:group II intron reverse transcriptase/maturase